MTPSFFERLFHPKHIPEALMSQLETETIVLLDESVKGFIVYLNFKAPGRASLLRRVGIAASLVLTKKRLLVVSGGKPLIDVPLIDERLGAMRFSLEESGLCVTFDAGLFHTDWSGTIEYHLHTQQASRFLELLNEQKT
jgi:hypothetical protein